MRKTSVDATHYIGHYIQYLDSGKANIHCVLLTTPRFACKFSGSPHAAQRMPQFIQWFETLGCLCVPCHLTRRNAAPFYMQPVFRCLWLQRWRDQLRKGRKLGIWANATTVDEELENRTPKRAIATVRVCDSCGV